MIYSTFVRGNTIRANGIRQHYLRFGGKGEPLILVPGIVSPAIMWDFVADRLGAVYDTYVIDVRGRGLSEANDAMDFSLNAYAADVSGFAEVLGLDSYILVGHSMGARIALRTALNHAKGLSQIVMADPPMSGPGRRPYPVPIERVMDMLAMARRGELWDATKDDKSWPEHSNRMRAEWMHTCNESAVVSTHRNFHLEDIFPDFAHVKVRTSLMIANKGGTIQPPDVEEIKTLMPSIAIDYVDSGHMIPFETLDGFLTSLGKLLGQKF